MTWFNILKFYGPRDFMQDLQEMLGGEIISSSRAKGIETVLQYSNGNIKLQTTKGMYIIRVNGEIVSRAYDLKRALEIVKEHLSKIEKSSKRDALRKREDFSNYHSEFRPDGRVVAHLKEIKRYRKYLEDLDMFLEVLGYSEDSYEQEVLRSLRNTLDQLKNPKYKSNPSKYADEIWELESSFLYSAEEITMNRVPSFTE